MRNSKSIIMGDSDLDSARREFTHVLGIGQMPDACFRAAIANPLYAHHLLTCRNAPEFLNRLIENPPEPHPLSKDSSLVVAARAATALVRWAKTGFSTVADDVYVRRVEACRLCPHSVRVGEQQSLIHQLASTFGDSDALVCGQCGCYVSRKTLLPSEACPDADPTDPSVSRWGEPVTKTRNRTKP